MMVKGMFEYIYISTFVSVFGDWKLILVTVNRIIEVDTAVPSHSLPSSSPRIWAATVKEQG